jgi:hypothetical protein
MRNLLGSGVEIRVVEVDLGVIDAGGHGDMVADLLPVEQRENGESIEIRGYELDLESEFRQPQPIAFTRPAAARAHHRPHGLFRVVQN